MELRLEPPKAQSQTHNSPLPAVPPTPKHSVTSWTRRSSIQPVYTFNSQTLSKEGLRTPNPFSKTNPQGLTLSHEDPLSTTLRFWRRSLFFPASSSSPGHSKLRQECSLYQVTSPATKHLPTSSDLHHSNTCPNSAPKWDTM